jgi:hypothetical protein
LDHIGFEVWRFDLAGIAHSFWFALSFFLDSQTYSSIKESLITSPSVLIVNQLLGFAVVDFPKSMVLDVLLSFGLFGLFGVAIFLGSLIAQVQRQISRFRGFQMKFLLSLYSLPMLLEFEKEFIGFLFSFLKWLPVFLIIYWLRPRFKRQCSQQNITTTNHCSLR